MALGESAFRSHLTLFRTKKGSFRYSTLSISVNASNHHVTLCLWTPLSTVNGSFAGAAASSTSPTGDLVCHKEKGSSTTFHRINKSRSTGHDQQQEATAVSQNDRIRIIESIGKTCTASVNGATDMESILYQQIWFCRIDPSTLLIHPTGSPLCRSYKSLSSAADFSTYYWKTFWPGSQCWQTLGLWSSNCGVCSTQRISGIQRSNVGLEGYLCCGNCPRTGLFWFWAATNMHTAVQLLLCWIMGNHVWKELLASIV